MAAMVWSCSDDEYSFSASDKLTFSADTVYLDTIFSNVPSATRTFWAFNRSGRNVRLQTVRLERGNQSGFRVNVDGVFLGPATGYQTNEVEVRRGDSIRVFVELTSTTNGEAEPKELRDNIVFSTDGGAVQKVNLRAYSWDAVILASPVVRRDTTFTPEKPIVIYGGLRVDSLATLTLAAGTTLYFRDEASLDVYGRLVAAGEPDKEVVLRGYRLDNLFDYLPYDRLSGQWGGVRIHESSYGNRLQYTDIHGAFDGIAVDSCDVSKRALAMNACSVHNCQGYGVKAKSSWLELSNCQISNALQDCVSADGGLLVMNNCTVAQYYNLYNLSFGVALRFTGAAAPMQLACYNSLITGSSDDEIMGEQGNAENAFYYEFGNCILRTPAVETDDSVYFKNVVFEDVRDTLTTGKKHFLTCDSYNQKYNFRLALASPAIDAADPLTAMPLDRNGLPRDDRPDIGAFEAAKDETTAPTE